MEEEDLPNIRMAHNPVCSETLALGKSLLTISYKNKEHGMKNLTRLTCFKTIRCVCSNHDTGAARPGAARPGAALP